MKNNTSLIYNVCLVIGDALALLVAFVVAYILRVTISDRQLAQQVFAADYLQTLTAIIPFFILIFALLGLYTARIHDRRFEEFGKLLVGCFIGILFVISYAYILDVVIFPARLVVLYSLGLTFVLVLVFRTMARGFRRQLFSYGVGINNVLIIGDTKRGRDLIASLSHTGATGYKVRALVSQTLQPGRPSTKYAHFKNFGQAVGELPGSLHTIIQTELYADGERNDEILTYAQNHHIAYRFVPGNSELFTGNIDAEVFHSVPVIAVHQTALIGWGRVVKRLFDIAVAATALIFLSPVMVIVAILVKVSDGGSIIFRQERLSRFDSKVEIFKFRSHLTAYNGMSPEAAFTKMKRPELIAEYRTHADSLPRDPRISSVGHFIRDTKLDELPQLINVLRGDISLVGPRALVAFELDQYSQKNLILSVKSGLTGLAQVAGRPDMSFDERRALDLYYVQNWSFWSDIVILVKTAWIIFAHKGVR